MRNPTVTQKVIPLVLALLVSLPLLPVAAPHGDDDQVELRVTGPDYETQLAELFGTAGVAYLVLHNHAGNKNPQTDVTQGIQVSGPGGSFSLDMMETGADTGVFTGSFGFATDATTAPTAVPFYGKVFGNGRLKVTNGDTVTVSALGQNTTFKWFASVNGAVTDWEDVARTTAQAAKVFGWSDSVYYRLADTDLNRDGTAAESVLGSLRIYSDTDVVGEYVQLVETGPSTGQFYGTMSFEPTVVANNGRVAAQSGDRIFANYQDARNANGVVASVDLPPRIFEVVTDGALSLSQQAYSGLTQLLPTGLDRGTLLVLDPDRDTALISEDVRVLVTRDGAAITGCADFRAHQLGGVNGAYYATIGFHNGAGCSIAAGDQIVRLPVSGARHTFKFEYKDHPNANGEQVSRFAEITWIQPTSATVSIIGQGPVAKVAGTVNTYSVRLLDADADLDPKAIDTARVTLYSTSDPTQGATIDLRETGENSGNFSGSFGFTTAGNSGGGFIKVADRDLVRAVYQDALNADAVATTVWSQDVVWRAPATGVVTISKPKFYYSLFSAAPGAQPNALGRLYIEDRDQDDPRQRDTITATLLTVVPTGQNPATLRLQLLETGVSTGFFEAPFRFSTEASTQRLFVGPDDATFRAEYRDATDAGGLPRDIASATAEFIRPTGTQKEVRLEYTEIVEGDDAFMQTDLVRLDIHAPLDPISVNTDQFEPFDNDDSVPPFQPVTITVYANPGGPAPTVQVQSDRCSTPGGPAATRLVDREYVTADPDQDGRWTVTFRMYALRNDHGCSSSNSIWDLEQAGAPPAGFAGPAIGVNGETRTDRLSIRSAGGFDFLIPVRAPQTSTMRIEDSTGQPLDGAAKPVLGRDSTATVVFNSKDHNRDSKTRDTAISIVSSKSAQFRGTDPVPLVLHETGPDTGEFRANVGHFVNDDPADDSLKVRVETNPDAEWGLNAPSNPAAMMSFDSVVVTADFTVDPAYPHPGPDNLQFEQLETEGYDWYDTRRATMVATPRTFGVQDAIQIQVSADDFLANRHEQTFATFTRIQNVPILQLSKPYRDGSELVYVTKSDWVPRTAGDSPAPEQTAPGVNGGPSRVHYYADDDPDAEHVVGTAHNVLTLPFGAERITDRNRDGEVDCHDMTFFYMDARDNNTQEEDRNPDSGPAHHWFCDETYFLPTVDMVDGVVDWTEWKADVCPGPGPDEYFLTADDVGDDSEAAANGQQVGGEAEADADSGRRFCDLFYLAYEYRATRTSSLGYDPTRYTRYSDSQIRIGPAGGTGFSSNDWQRVANMPRPPQPSSNNASPDSYPSNPNPGVVGAGGPFRVSYQGATLPLTVTSDKGETETVSIPWDAASNSYKGSVQAEPTKIVGNGRIFVGTGPSKLSITYRDTQVDEGNLTIVSANDHRLVTATSLWFPGQDGVVSFHAPDFSDTPVSRVSGPGVAVQVQDKDGDRTSAQDAVVIAAYPGTDVGSAVYVSLRETTGERGIFRGIIPIGGTGGVQMPATGGTLTAKYTDPLTSQGDDEARSVSVEWTPAKTATISLYKNDGRTEPTTANNTVVGSTGAFYVTIRDEDANRRATAQDIITAQVFSPGDLIGETIQLRENGTNVDEFLSGAIRFESAATPGNGRIFVREIGLIQDEARVRYFDSVNQTGRPQIVTSTGVKWDRTYDGVLDIQRPSYVGTATNATKAVGGLREIGYVTVADGDCNLNPLVVDRITTTASGRCPGLSAFKLGVLSQGSTIPTPVTLLQLTETGANTGIFIGTFTFAAGTEAQSAETATERAKIKVAFNARIGAEYVDPHPSTGTGTATFRDDAFWHPAGFGTVEFDRAGYDETTDEPTVRLYDADLKGRGSATVRVKSAADPAGINANLTEVGPGLFEAELHLTTTGSSGTNQLRILLNDELVATYDDSTPAGVRTANASIGIGNKIAPLTTLTTTPAQPTGLRPGSFKAPVEFALSVNKKGVDTFYQLGPEAGVQVYSKPVVLGPGAYEVRYWSEDPFGNKEDVKTQTIVVDATAPTAKVTGVVAKASRAGSINVTWNPATARGDLLQFYDYVVFRDNASVPMGNTTTESFLDTTLTDENAHTYRVAIRDYVGNQGPTSGFATATPDSSAPLLTLPTVTPNTFDTRAPPAEGIFATVMVTDSKLESVKFFLAEPGGDSVASVDLAKGVGNQWIGKLGVTHLTQACRCDAVFAASDQAGNIGELRFPFIVEGPDTTPPSIEADLPATGEVPAGTQVEVRVADNVALTSVTWQLDSADAVPVSIPAAGSGNLTFNVGVGVIAGTHTLTVRAVDNAKDASGGVARNTAERTFTFSVTEAGGAVSTFFLPTSARAVSDGIRVNWTLPDGVSPSMVGGFIVWRSSSPWTYLTEIKNSGAREFTDRTVKDGESYQYAVTFFTPDRVGAARNISDVPGFPGEENVQGSQLVEADKSGGLGWLWTILSIAVLVGLAVLIIVLVARGKKPPRGRDGDEDGKTTAGETAPGSGPG